MLFSAGIFAQFDHEPVLSGLSGPELLDELQNQYKPETVLDFADAKDILYGEIYARNDSVKCVYSGHILYLDPNADPSVWLYMNGSDNGINSEHTYPRSKGASSGNAQSDMYNLFPSRVRVNTDRGNLPFGEIHDNITQYWYFLDDRLTSIPSANIDAYSEITSSFFEPREDHKGNVARAIFYFVTMYEQEVQAADPGYFLDMQETLCDWHYYDPVDSLEWFRNEKIASYQSGKENPFILDCSLAGRSYCDFIDPSCTSVGIPELPDQVQEPHLKLFPNPASQVVNVEFDHKVQFLKIELVDLLGRSLYEVPQYLLSPAHEKQIRIDLSSFENGLLQINTAFKYKNKHYSKSKKLLINQ